MSQTSAAGGSDDNTVPVPDNTALNPIGYTARRLKDASPEHLHLTTRRFFIGPIPEGWLNSNRKSWYRRRQELFDWASNATSSDAAAHDRARTLAQEPALAARLSFSFPQPVDVFTPCDPTDPATIHATDEAEDEGDEEDDDSVEVATENIAPVATHDPSAASHPQEAIDDADNVKQIPGSSDQGIREEAGVSAARSPPSVNVATGRTESFKTAPETRSRATTTATSAVGLTPGRAPHDYLDGRPSSSMNNRDSLRATNDSTAPPDNVDSSSRKGLLAPDSPAINARPSSEHHPVLPSDLGDRAASPTDIHTMRTHEPAPLSNQVLQDTWDSRPSRVRFTEGVVDRKRRIEHQAGRAKDKVRYNMRGRSTLRDGAVIKMERVLVRTDYTMQQLPDDFDENESIKTETRPIDKWREYMAVARLSGSSEDEDFRLQMYTTRVIPELDTDRSRAKKPTREIKLLSKSTHINLYSSLDKTVVIWHPYKKGTRIIIMKPCSAAHAVEWYTFLRDALGSPRASNLQVSVPDLDVSLNIDKPFQSLQPPELEEPDEQTLLKWAVDAESAVAERVIVQSLRMLEKNPEWAAVLKDWSQTAKMGLAWKRYDRLEWVYGVHEQNMYGSMAMQHSYDLELRPKQHYPTQARGKKGKPHEEPPPLEGFLIRLTSQKGMHHRWGKAFYKRLYFSTHDQFLLFNRPAKATPPHPPRLRTLTTDGVPSSADIVRKTPTMFEIAPYELDGKEIRWLREEDSNTFAQHDVEAQEEFRRNVVNIESADGFINMCQIKQVRTMRWGATEADEGLDSGSEVDFHDDVDNTRREDGVTTIIDDDRTFELVLVNGLVIRLQASSVDTRDEWIKRLRQLLKYWKRRTMADMMDLKSTRKANLEHLQIDEDQEARLGQFARKWEVSRSDASPDLYNMCRLTACRAITFSGVLYRKARRRGAFQKCSVLLSSGQMLVFQAGLRRSTGQQIAHVHEEVQQVIDLRDSYVYSGLIVEDDLLYHNQTFDSNHAGMLAATPRVYREDNWTATDVDVMTCFVVWMNRRKGWFKSVVSNPGGQSDGASRDRGERRSTLRRVAQLGVPGRGMVFKCRSRAERDLWVTSVAAEIERAVEKELHARGKGRGETLNDVRLQT